MKKCSTSPVIKIMQIKVTIRYYNIFTSMSNMRKTDSTKQFIATRNLIIAGGGYTITQPLWQSLIKLKHTLYI